LKLWAKLAAGLGIVKKTAAHFAEATGFVNGFIES